MEKIRDLALENAWFLWDKVAYSSRAASDWVKKNRRRLLVGALIGGSSFLAYRFVKGKMVQFQQQQMQISLEETKTFEKFRMQQYFAKSQKRCDGMLLRDVIPTLQEKLMERIQIPSKAELKLSIKGPKEQKMAIWGKAKIQIFVRTISAIFASCLMTLFLRVEVNILGRYLYLDILNDTDINSNTEDEKPISADVQQKFLSFANSGYIQGKGLQKLIQFIEEITTDELSSWPLTKKCSFEDLEKLLSQLSARVYKDGNSLESKFSEFLLENLLMPNMQLQVLVTETRDVLESKQFESILKTCVDRGFACLTEQLRGSFGPAEEVSTDQESGKEDTKVVALPFAKIGTFMKKQFKILLNNRDDDTQTFLKSLFELKELEEYSYYIFTSSYDQE